MIALFFGSHSCFNYCIVFLETMLWGGSTDAVSGFLPVLYFYVAQSVSIIQASNIVSQSSKVFLLSILHSIAGTNELCIQSSSFGSSSICCSLYSAPAPILVLPALFCDLSIPPFRMFLDLDLWFFLNSAFLRAEVLNLFFYIGTHFSTSGCNRDPPH